MGSREPSSRLTERQRLAVLRQLQLLDTLPEEAFDKLTRLVLRVIQAPVALISLVDRDRQFFKSATGLPEPWASRRETPLSHSFCQHVVASGDPLIVSDARAHPLVCDNLAIRELNVAAYLGVPLRTTCGAVLGSLCVIDQVPRQWVEAEIDTLKDVAAAVMTEIELRAAAQAQKQLFAMINHDMRSPVQTLLTGLELLNHHARPNQAEALDLMRRSVRGLARLVDDLVDVSAMDSGAFHVRPREVALRPLLEAFCQTHAPQVLERGLDFRRSDFPEATLRVDAERLVQVLGNLMQNALKFTPEDGFIELGARLHADEVVIALTNSGSEIAQRDLERIFDRYWTARSDGHAAHSLGLGLFICREIIEHHDGRVWAESGPDWTRFLLALPAAR